MKYKVLMKNQEYYFPSLREAVHFLEDEKHASFEGRLTIKRAQEWARYCDAQITQRR